MSSAVCNQVDLHYECYGPADAPPLLCVMGLGADCSQWALNVEAFAEAHRLVIFDNRDVGRSGYAHAPYEISDMAADALALADHLGLGRFHLLGVSMGGAISQQIALIAAERLLTLTICASWAGGGRWWRQRQRATWAPREPLTEPSEEQLLARAREEAEHLLILTLSAETYEDDRVRERAIKRILASPHPQHPDGFRRQAAAASRHEVRDRLVEIAVATHVIGAECDVLIPVWKSKEIAAAIVDAELTVIEGAAHGMNLEHAREFNAAALGFIERPS